MFKAWTLFSKLIKWLERVVLLNVSVGSKEREESERRERERERTKHRSAGQKRILWSFAFKISLV